MVRKIDLHTNTHTGHDVNEIGAHSICRRAKCIPAAGHSIQLFSFAVFWASDVTNDSGVVGSCRAN